MEERIALIIEDESIVRDLIKIILTQRDFICFTAADGEEGLALLKSHPEAKVAFIDHEMPKKNGTELLNALFLDASYSAQAKCKIIGMSGKDSWSVSKMNTYLAKVLKKPFTPSEMYRALEEVGA